MVDAGGVAEKTMPSTHTSLHYHIVFSTKDRFPSILPSWRVRLHEYLGGCVRTLGAHPVRVGGMFDHVHLLLGAKPIHAIAGLVREIKKASSVWVHDEFDKKFAWQEGYGAFTVSRGDLPAVEEYVASQEEHHRTRTFQEEYLAFLEAQGIEFDPKYLW